MNEFLSDAHFLDGPRNKGQIRADAWKYNEKMEELAELAVSRPEIFERMNSTMRMSLGYYQSDKTHAAAYGRDVTKEGK